MKKKLSLSLVCIAIFALTACSNSEEEANAQEVETSVESSEEDVNIPELTQEQIDDLYDSYKEDQSEVTYTMNDLEDVLYEGMTYNDFVEVYSGNYHVLEAFQSEESNQVLYVFLASDGFLGVLETPNEGLQKFERFQDMHDASQYFN